MKKLFTGVLLLLLALSVYATEVTKPTHITINPSGGAPSAPTNVIIAQQGGTGTCNWNTQSGCLSNSQKLQWTASVGATYYTVLRNGASIGSGGCSGSISATNCTDGTATNSNVLNTYTTETIYQYSVEACNGSGCSAGVTPAFYNYSGGPNNSCSSYSGGGFGATVTTVSGSKVMTVVTNAGNPMNPYQGILPDGGNAFPQASPAGPQTPSQNYILPFGTGGTSGTGGTGTYELSLNAAATVSSAEALSALPESCWVTQVTELGHTYSKGSSWQGGGYMAQITGPPGVPPEDAAIGAMTYAVVDIYPTDCTHTGQLFEMTRPGGYAAGTGDVFSNRIVTLFTNCTSSYGTLSANAWSTLKIPMTALGEGTGTFVGYVHSPWHGQGSASSGSTATLTISATTDGAIASMANGDYLMAFLSSGTYGLEIMSGGGTSTPVVEACPGGELGESGVPTIPAGTHIYDAQAVVQSTSGTPVDMAGMVTGNTIPNGSFTQCFSGAVNASVGTWGLGNGNGTQIPAEGSSGSPLTFNFQRVSIYKPDVTVTGTGATTVFWDQRGWSN